MKKLLFVLTVTVATIGCSNQTSTDKQTTDTKKDTVDLVQKAKADSIKKAQADSIAKVNEAQRADNLKRRDALKKNFNYKKDEFKDVGFYIHKSQTVDNSYNRKCLITHINSNGYIYLEDQYYADDWIFHTSIQVKIGDKIYNSSVVETYSDHNKTQNSGGSVWENITYTDDQDEKIIKAIADNADKEIKVRFNGKQYYSDFTLSKKDKQAIKDGYELSELIKKVGN
jgi:hypothetical protein